MIRSDSIKRNCPRRNWFPSIGLLIGPKFKLRTFFCSQKLRIQYLLVFTVFMIIEIFNFYDFALGWERKTHRELTQKAIEVIQIIEPGFNVNLINNLDLKNGLNESIDGMTVKQMIIEGSDLEDGPTDFSLRPRTHFHEPTTNAGLFGRFESAMEWSLKPFGTQDGEDSYSWNDAREYFFNALTLSTPKERDENWKKTFRALGQVMHLLQDSANPSHVRDDQHTSVFGRGDVDGLHDYMARQSVESYPGATFFTPDPSLLQTPHTEGPPDPLANLFDTNTYTGASPGATLGNDVGITEYTNANFFSDDTIPGQDQTNLPFPNALELAPSPVPLPYLTLPRLGSPTFPAARAAKLTGNQAAAQFFQTNTSLDLIGQLQLDDGVYDAQAQNLIPRAVDYSAEVLRYFFRGQLEVISEEFAVRGQNIGGELCNEIPADDFGGLVVEVSIPAELEFLGKASLYYDDSEEKRKLVAEQLILSPGGEVSFLEDLLHGGIPNPVRWTVVLDGEAGPGEKEPRTIVGKTSEAPWRFVCIF